MVTRRRVGEVGRMAVVLSNSENRVSKKSDSSASEWRTGGIARAVWRWLETRRGRGTQATRPCSLFLFGCVGALRGSNPIFLSTTSHHEGFQATR